jgi:hypothetical protein
VIVGVQNEEESDDERVMKMNGEEPRAGAEGQRGR